MHLLVGFLPRSLADHVCSIHRIREVWFLVEVENNIARYCFYLVLKTIFSIHVIYMPGYLRVSCFRAFTDET